MLPFCSDSVFVLVKFIVGFSFTCLMYCSLSGVSVFLHVLYVFLLIYFVVLVGFDFEVLFVFY
jgi:hypothetical protein